MDLLRAGGGLEKSRLGSIPPDLTRIPCSRLFDRRGWIMGKDEYIENETSEFKFVMRE